MSRSYDISTRYTWHGWETGDDVTPPEPGKEWIEISEDGEEFAVIVLRTDASIFSDDPDALERARNIREHRAQFIVDALNTWEEAR